MWLVSRLLVFVFVFSVFVFVFSSLGIWREKKKNKKNQREIFKKEEDSIVMEEIVNEGFEERLDSIKKHRWSNRRS